MAVIHVVSKKDNALSATVIYDEAPQPLANASIRVKSELVAITSKNLSYARNGTVLHWWELYPVPPNAASPYNSSEEWGIVPAWGYGTVLQSNIEAVKPGSMLYGFWPTSSHHFDLKLEPWIVTGHWNEVSKHRARNMTMYNRYIQVPTPPSDPERALIAGVQAVWQCGYLLNTATFSDDSRVRPIHPLGIGLDWTDQDADLSHAVVIILSAGSKTARSLAWNLSRNRDQAANGPIGLLQVTANPKSLLDFANPNLSTYTTIYEDLIGRSTLSWLAKLEPSRFVTLDCGAATSVSQDLNAALTANFLGAQITNLAIGSESKVYTAEEAAKNAASKALLKKVQVNTSTLRDGAIEAASDPTEWYDGMEAAWLRCIEEGGMGEIEVLWRRGVQGPNGMKECGKTFAVDVSEGINALS